MVRIAKLGVAFLLFSVPSWKSASAQEQWRRCVAKVEKAPVVIVPGFDNTDHPGGGYHEARLFFFRQCQYFRDCTTACFVDAAAWVDEDGVDLTRAAAVAIDMCALGAAAERRNEVATLPGELQ
jgi:hypothetical protein